MNTHPSDNARLVSVDVVETVQIHGETSTRVRSTVQDANKLPRDYVLPGETQAQKLESLRAWVASNRVYHPLELLAYIEDVMQAPAGLSGVTLVVERFDPDMEERADAGEVS